MLLPELVADDDIQVVTEVVQTVAPGVATPLGEVSGDVGGLRYELPEASGFRGDRNAVRRTEGERLIQKPIAHVADKGNAAQAESVDGVTNLSGDTTLDQLLIRREQGLQGEQPVAGRTGVGTEGTTLTRVFAAVRSAADGVSLPAHKQNGAALQFVPIVGGRPRTAQDFVVALVGPE